MDEQNSQNNAITTGRKVFFIQPDPTLLPEFFCEDYLCSGFECYFAMNIRYCPLEEYIDHLVTTFSDLILFFNIDFPPPGDDSWPAFISRINKKYNSERVLIGVMYTRKQNKDDKALIEKAFLYKIGIMAGCVELDYQKKNNYGIIKKALFANQAMGRRKQVRALCMSNCSFNFSVNKKLFAGQIQDISLSHFSILLPHGALNVPLYEKIDGIQMSIKGIHIRTSAILFMSRTVENGDNDLLVFMFIKRDGSQGLEESMKTSVLPKIYEMLNDNCMNLLNETIRKKQTEE